MGAAAERTGRKRGLTPSPAVEGPSGPGASGSSSELGTVEFEAFRAFLYDRTGIRLNDSKRLLVQNRLRPRLKELGLASYTAYLRHLRGRVDEETRFISSLTTNETYFYREEKHWEFLRDVLVPGWVKERGAGMRSISIWSAAASTGEELHTAALVLLEALPDTASWRIQLVGTDVDPEVIARARAGLYSDYAVRNVSEALRRKYFLEGEEKGRKMWRVRDEVRRLCRFDVHNLLRPFPARRFDVVFCRNVFIYFDPEAKARVLENLIASAANGGHIIFSHTESVFRRPEGLEPVRTSVFRRAK